MFPQWLFCCKNVNGKNKFGSIKMLSLSLCYQIKNMAQQKTHTIIVRKISKQNRNILKTICKEKRISLNSLMLLYIDDVVNMFQKSK